jgi:ATP-binding cassette, subfamily C, bacterial
MMNTLQFILSNFKKFLSFKKRKLFIIYILAVLLAFTQGIGFIMLIPLLQMLKADASYSDNFIGGLLNNTAQFFQIPLTFESILLVYLIILTVYFLLQYGRIVMQSSYQHEHSGFLRKELFKKVIFSDWSVLTKISRSQHIQAFTSEIPRVTHFYFYLLNASTKIIILVIHILLAFLVSPSLTAVVVITGAIMFAVLAAYFRRSYGLGMQGRKTFRKVMKNIDDFWVTIKPAKVHNTEQFYYDNYARTDQQFVSNQVQQIRNNQKPLFLFNIFGLMNLVIVIFIASRFFQIHLAVLIVIILLFSRILPLFMSLFQDVNLMFLNTESVKNLQRMNFQPHQHADVPEFPDKSFMLKESITVSGLSFTYPSGKEIFRDFNIQIKAFCLTGITGESGSGKTTLIDLISGLLQADKGRIFYDDQEISRTTSCVFRQGSAICLRNLCLLMALSGKISYGMLHCNK